MKYVQFINSVLKSIIQKENDLVVYGQNINAGSCLSGLTRGLGNVNKGLTINTQNSENTLVGVGFGLMLNSSSSIFFMKQMDFLLLSVDHLVNTYNIIRQNEPTASFTIFPVSVDSGYEGAQSALNNFNDFCSIAGIDGYSFTNRIDTKRILSKYVVQPGFRILSPSQRLLQKDMLDIEVVNHDDDFRYFQYEQGHHASIVCFNFSLPYGVILHETLSKKGIRSSLFSINSYSEFDYSSIIDDLCKTRNLILIDDSKSKNRLSDNFLNYVYCTCELDKIIILDRKYNEDLFFPRHDQLDIDYMAVAEKLGKFR